MMNMTPSEKELGEKLKKLRLESNMSQLKISVLLRVTQNTVFKYKAVISFSPMRILMFHADYFSVSLDWMFGRCSNRESKLYTGISKSGKQRL